MPTINQVTKEDLADWLESPVTQAWFAGIRWKIKELKESHNLQMLVDFENPNRTAMKLAHLTGWVSGLEDATEIDKDMVIGDE